MMVWRKLRLVKKKVSYDDGFMVVYFNYPNQPGLHNQNTSSDSIRSNYMIFK